jgi:hypothetical protein
MRLVIALCALLVVSTSAAARAQPPIQGVTGTVATEGTIDAEHKAAGKIASGVKKILPGGKGSAQNPLDGFTDGLKVVVRDGDETTEGVVIDVNRSRQQITIRIAERKTQTLRLFDRAAAGDSAPAVVVSYTDQVGTKVEHDFKRVS